MIKENLLVTAKAFLKFTHSQIRCQHRLHELNVLIVLVFVCEIIERSLLWEAQVFGKIIS